MVAGDGDVVDSSEGTAGVSSPAAPEVWDVVEGVSVDEVVVVA